MNAFALLALAALIQAFLAGAALTPLARVLGPKLGMIDEPTEARKIHSHTTPRSGGLALFAAFWGCLGLNLLLAAWFVPNSSLFSERVQVLASNIGMALPELAGIAAGALIIFVLGAADDARGLSPRLRLAVQFLATIPPIAMGAHVTLFFLPDWAGWIATSLWIVLLTNSLNFLDNMNGLTSGIAVIVSLVLGIASLLSGEYYMLLLFALLAGASLGFWIFNFPKASIFLGDSGSTHLGFLFGCFTVVATYWDPEAPTRLPILIPALALGVPLFDTATVMWIRWRTGQPLMRGDRNHFSHRLVDLGMSRAQAVVFIYGVTLAVGLAAIVLRVLDWKHALVQVVLIGMVFLGIYRLERVSKHRNRA